MKTRTISKVDVTARPYEVWNAFVGLLAHEPYGDLDPQQRPAKLVFCYESEVQNGGHLQYFENHRGEHLDETVAALALIGAVEHKEVLRQAASRLRKRQRSPIKIAKGFTDAALEGEFSDLDSRFYACAPSLPLIFNSTLRPISRITSRSANDRRFAVGSACSSRWRGRVPIPKRPDSHKV